MLSRSLASGDCPVGAISASCVVVVGCGHLLYATQKQLARLPCDKIALPCILQRHL